MTFSAISLVPGDDWSEQITITDSDGSAMDLSGSTWTYAKVDWSTGSITLTLDTSQAASGIIGFSADKSLTGSLPFGQVSTITLKRADPSAFDETLYYAPVIGVHVKTANSISVVAAGTQGAPGIAWQGDWATSTAYALRDGVYDDGSSYRCILAHTSGASTEPGVGADWQTYWAVVALKGNLTAEFTAAETNAANSATAAAASASAAADSEAAAAISETNAAGSEAAAAASASAASTSETNAGNSATAASNSATAAATSEANAATSETNAATSETNAAASAVAADGSATSSEASRQAADVDAAQVATDKASVESIQSSLNTALGNVSSYDATLGLLSSSARAIVSAADVVDVFVYDTERDSDKGRWRKKTKATSWYKESLTGAWLGLAANETAARAISGATTGAYYGNTTDGNFYKLNAGSGQTQVYRGNRAEFPSKALIVARAATLTIYDLDQASCPMWTVFTNNVGNMTGALNTITAACLAAINGNIYFGAPSYDVHGIDLILDRSWRSGLGITTGGYVGRIANRSDGASFATVGWQPGAIISRAVNDVAATVLPGTPADPNRLNLPAPTVAVATAGGVSVIHWDGRVANSATTANSREVAFDPSNGDLIWQLDSSATPLLVARRKSYAVTSFSPDHLYNRQSDAASSGHYPGIGDANTNLRPVSVRGGLAVGFSGGLNIVKRSRISQYPVEDAAAYLTSKYNTGWQVGSIKFALAESTADVSSLVGATPLSDDFSGYADTAAMLAAWAASAGTNWSLSSGTALHAAGSTVPLAKAATLVVGARYRVTVTVSGRTAGSVTPRLEGTTTVAGSAISANGASSQSLIAVTGNNTVSFLPSSDFDGSIDNVTTQRVATDRSVAANHPTVVGTITRAAVNSGELAAYGGFSSSNYLALPAGHGFQPGTGDFLIALWLKQTATGAERRYVQTDGTTGNGNFYLGISATTSVPVFRATDDNYSTSDTITGALAFDDGNWHLFMVVRRGTTAELWVDGVLQASGTLTNANTSLTNLTVPLNFGAGVGGYGAMSDGNMALPRLGLTAPTPAQIRAIYEDERHLFESGAKCLLPGDSVSALAYDDTTDLLHVATTAGSARIKGLTVSDTDSTVYTGIDAKAGITTTRDSDSADISLPSIPLREAAAAGIGHNGGPPLYDRLTVDLPGCGVTTNATPTVIARLPMDKGEAGEWVIRTVAREYADPSSEQLAAYEDVVMAYRPGEGNIALSGSSTQRVINEVTSTMAVTVSANTTTQTIDITATGVSSKNIEWGVRAVFNPVAVQ